MNIVFNSSLKHLILSLLFIAAALLLFFNLFKEVPQKNKPTMTGPDYVLEEGVKSDTDPKTGKVIRIITVSRLEHTTAKGETYFESPIVVLKKEKATWNIRAKKGVAKESPEKQVDFFNQVVVEKKSEGQLPSTLFTEHLRYLPEKEKIETQLPVQIVQGKQHLEATGMRAFLNKKQIEFLSEVRGYYDPN